MQAHLPTLLEEVEAPAYLPDLVAAKAGQEHGSAGVDALRVAGDVERLHVVLDEAQGLSGLPEESVGAYGALHEFVVRVRLGGAEG